MTPKEIQALTDAEIDRAIGVIGTHPYGDRFKRERKRREIMERWREDCNTAGLREHDEARELRAALGQLLNQVYQMKDMFDDEDGAIASAVAVSEALLAEGGDA